MMSRPRLLLADDHLETAELLRELLQPEFDVIGHVTDGRTLVSDAERLSPDVIVSDISMPGLDGITAAAAILRREPGGPDHPGDACTAIRAWSSAAWPPARSATS